MFNFRYGLLNLLSAAGVAGVAGACALNGSQLARAVPSQTSELSINLLDNVATAPGWNERVVDCSDSETRCLRILNRMDLSFPRRCVGGQVIQWNTSIGQLRLVAPTLHARPPSGGYMSSNYPHIMFFVTHGSGLDQVVVTRQSPYDDSYNPADVVERFNVVFVGLSGSFDCRDT